MLNDSSFKIDKNGRLSVDSSNLIECVKFINSKRISKINISTMFTIEKLDFLKECPSVIDVYLDKSAVIDFSGLSSLPKLTRLSILEKFDMRQTISVAGLKYLKYLGVTDDFRILDIGQCTSLREIYCWKYKPKSKNLEEFSNLNNLEVLRITQGNLNDLKGIENLKLKKLELFYLRNLINIRELEGLSDTLSYLHFQNCPKIEGYKTLGNLKKLEWLKITKCADIPNLKFIRQMDSLKKMSFVDTNIVDGDLSPCIGLEFVGFMDKKQYSHKNIDLNPTR